MGRDGRSTCTHVVVFRPIAMDIEVKFDGTEIIVTEPGTDFMFAFRKRSDSPTLKLTRSWVGPHITSPAISEFRPTPFRQQLARRASWGGLCR